MTQRIPLDHLTSDDLDRLYDQLERAQRVALQALDDTAHDRTATAQPAGTRIHDGTPSPDLTAWLHGTPHTWTSGQLILHSPDGDTRPEPGWWLIRWDDDTITTASPTVAERVYGTDGLWGRLQHAEEQLALNLAEKKQCSAQQWPQRLARAETALARIQAIADDHPAGIDTALIHAALPDRPAATQATDVGTEFVQQIDHPDEAALAKVEADLAPARPWSTCTVPVDHGPHPWQDPWPLPHGQDAHCPGRPTPEPARSWLLAGTRDLDIPVDKNRPDSGNPQATGGGEVDNPADNQTAPDGLRARLAAAIDQAIDQAIDDDNLDNLTDLGERLTGAVLAAVTEHLEISEEQAWCKYCRRAWDSPAHRCESDAEQRVYGIAELRDRWLMAGPPPLGTSINRWWDKRLVELTNVLNGKQPGPA